MSNLEASFHDHVPGQARSLRGPARGSAVGSVAVQAVLAEPCLSGRFTGDQIRRWGQQNGLPAVVPAMLNGGLSGPTGGQVSLGS
jgi:hypothetical protein